MKKIILAILLTISVGPIIATAEEIKIMHLENYKGIMLYEEIATIPEPGISDDIIVDLVSQKRAHHIYEFLFKSEYLSFFPISYADTYLRRKVTWTGAKLKREELPERKAIRHNAETADIIMIAILPISLLLLSLINQFKKMEARYLLLFYTQIIISASIPILIKSILLGSIIGVLLIFLGVIIAARSASKWEEILNIPDDKPSSAFSHIIAFASAILSVFTNTSVLVIISSIQRGSYLYQQFIICTICACTGSFIFAKIIAHTWFHFKKGVAHS